MCSNKDPMLHDTIVKQNGRERDEEITIIHFISPGDVIPVTLKGGEGGRDNEKTSVNIDKH